MVKTFINLCDLLSDYCENEKEYSIILNVIKQWIHDNRTEERINEGMSEKMGIQLESINYIKKHTPA